jgi:hypothetical protein
MSEILPAEEIKELYRKAHAFEDRWLRNRGWEHTCDSPDSCWYWKKEWDGKVFMVTKGIASQIQEGWDFDEDFRLNPEKYAECS